MSSPRSRPRFSDDEVGRARANSPPPASPPPPYYSDPDSETTTTATVATPREDQPLLRDPAAAIEAGESWKPPRGFIWIELAIMANVFLYGLDGTITAATYAVISSEFDAANTASWLTTSYLVTSTAFQPLRSDDDGGTDIEKIATIVNSDMIPFRRRGMYQALQNGMFGFGAVAGASFGGSIADHIGWRWCFLLQVPVSIMALTLGALVIKNPEGGFDIDTNDWRAIWSRVDVSGALLLVVAISVQLVGLSLGGNELPWGSAIVIGTLVGSVLLLALFVLVEARTKAIPVIPLRMLRGKLPIFTQISNVCAGLAAYAYLFMLPLFFQVVLLDSATKAGARLAIPSLATPLGGLFAGIVMSRWGKLIWLVRAGAFLMLFGNSLVTALQFQDSQWKYLVYIFPANLGQGIIYPAILFTTLASFDHADHAVSASTVYLVRSLGTVWGVAITSAIVQTTLSLRLPEVLGDIPDKSRLIDEIRHSVTALKTLPVEVRLPARHVYYEGIQYAFAASTTFAGIALIAALFASPRGLRSTHK
ncbi:major facilitator superfamily transporter [Colletotrichum cuscutae]|uniref:Major facilitator superfamily transporter n=1 Tax=Colletotrichum cuscutae TaxID=1209917 RepID=A0AAI9Y882_9PEZI|nr:major facilitator superfamily transporter [Colletotrichum cuscutae]